MIIETVICKTGSFTDWLNEEHPFTVAGVIVRHETELILATPNKTIAPAVQPVIERNNDGHIRKSLFVGISICNPKDKDRYNARIGERIAVNKALSQKLPQRWLATDCSGLINEAVAEVVLEQEVNYIKEHPESVIKGYNESKARYEQKQLAAKLYKELPGPEQATVQTLIKGKNLGKLVAIADALGDELLKLPAPEKKEEQKPVEAPAEQLE